MIYREPPKPRPIEEIPDHVWVGYCRRCRVRLLTNHVGLYCQDCIDNEEQRIASYEGERIE